MQQNDFEAWRLPPGDHSRSLTEAISFGDVEAVQRHLARNPAGLREVTTSSYADTWVHYAVYKGSLPIVDFLLQSGLSMNEVNAAKAGERGRTSVLEIAASKHPELVVPLLARGADPNSGRPVISALNLTDEGEALRVVRALIEAGVDVNKVYDLYGDSAKGFTALEFAAGKPDVTAYLRSVGGVDRTAPRGPTAEATRLEEVVGYFGNVYGSVEPESLWEVAPTTNPPVIVRVVGPSAKSDCVTLFTTVLSLRAMNVPKGAEPYKLAELFVQLPADWPLTADALGSPEFGWPVLLLRSLAGAPEAERTWLGVGLSSVAHGNPPTPVGPGVQFTAARLAAGDTIRRADGEVVQLYRVVPITTAEHELLVAKGAKTLSKLLDIFRVGVVVSPYRKSVV